MNFTTQETNSEAMRAVDCHYSQRWQAIYTKGQPAQAVSGHTSTYTPTNGQEPIVHIGTALLEVIDKLRLDMLCYFDWAV